MRTLLIQALVFCVAPTFASADNTLSAGDLLDACSRPDTDWVSFCNGYFQAAHDFGALSNQVCITEGATRTDLVTGFETEAKRILRETPASKSDIGLLFAASILASLYPC